VDEPQPQTERSDRDLGFFLVVAMVAIMWVVEAIDQVSNANLDSHGIEPRQVDGLEGVVTAPFLHAGWSHLIGNTVPFVLLGLVIALNGLARIAGVTVIVALVGGIGTWVIAPAHTNHIGASGLVFGFATYLMARFFYSRNLLHLAVGVVVFAVYGSTLLFGLVPRDGISWQGHLFGGIGGIVAARVLDSKRRRVEPATAALDAGAL
jgi:membrane associated rhomboid family serine protease